MIPSTTFSQRTRRPSGRRTHSFTKRPFEAARFQPQFTGDLAPSEASPVDFAALNLDPRLNRGLADLGFVRTTSIQSAAIPLVLAGGDLIGCAQTGTGKTAAFLLPIMQRLLGSTGALAPPKPSSGEGARTSTRVLVLAPTRELAAQIEEDFQGLGYHTDLSAVAVYGGVEAGPQSRALSALVDVVVATPGRLIDHMNTGVCTFDGLEVLVIDEADRMLDMGFWPSVRRIVAALPSARQTLLFAATLSDDVLQSSRQIMRDPKMIRVGRTGGLASTITHRAHHVSAIEKAAWLSRFLRRSGGPAIVFVRTKRGADRLARRLAAAGVRCAALHADRSQSQRTAALEGFRAGHYRGLVATDIAARGIDIEGVAHVINYEVPTSADAYVHRVGRTGRAEASGVALTLVAREEEAALRALEQSLNIRLADLHAVDGQAIHASQ